MKWYEIFETTTGHIIILTFLLLAGWGAWALGMPKAEDVTLGSFTALLALLKNGKKLID